MANAIIERLPINAKSSRLGVYLAATLLTYTLYILVSAFAYKWAWDSRSVSINSRSVILSESESENIDSVVSVPALSSVILGGSVTFDPTALLKERNAAGPHCKGHIVSSFGGLIPSFRLYATYDTLARWAEACVHNTNYSAPVDEEAAAAKESAVSVLKSALELCAGTRKVLSGSDCAKSLEFVDSLYEYDKTAGLVESTVMILLGLIVGLFQLACLLLVVIASLRCYYLGVDVGHSELSLNSDASVEEDTSLNLDRSSYSSYDNAQLALQKVQAEESRGEELQRFLLERDRYESRVAGRLNSLDIVEESIVLVGFLGTLWGLAALFSSIGKSISASPLTAEIAKSELFGAMGLAFGTTLFAVVLKMIFQHYLTEKKSVIGERISTDFINASKDLAFTQSQASGLDSGSIKLLGQRALAHSALDHPEGVMKTPSRMSAPALAVAIIISLVLITVLLKSEGVRAPPIAENMSPVVED
ncbi:MAG: MotA/TolQ/ExbB proton channel family protein [Pseudomonadales bacterium]|nr:MotA/TolQ/ExbB proton channel family protein [Pseudomonadales bacterium]